MTSKTSNVWFAEIGMLAKTLSPLLTAMKIWGSYFTCSQSTSTLETTITPMNMNLKQKFLCCKIIYPTGILLLNWASVLRLCFAFSNSNGFVSVYSEKLPMLLIFMQSAVTQTSYYMASYNGTLSRILSELKITPDLAKLMNRRVFVMIVVNVCMITSLIGLFIYELFLTNHDLDYFVAPFVTLIPISDGWLKVAKLTFIISFFVLQQGLQWPTAMNFALTEVIVRRFNMCSSQFNDAIDRRGKFNGDMRSFRQTHQDLTEVVHAVDSFMRFGNVSGFLCQMFSVVTLLYWFIFDNQSGTDVMIIYATLFAANVFGLASCTFSGILVNHTVCSLLYVIIGLMFQLYASVLLCKFLVRLLTTALLFAIMIFLLGVRRITSYRMFDIG